MSQTLSGDGKAVYTMEGDRGNKTFKFKVPLIPNTIFKNLFLGTEGQSRDAEVPCTFSELTLLEQIGNMLLELACKVGGSVEKCSLKTLREVPVALKGYAPDVVKKASEFISYLQNAIAKKAAQWTLGKALQKMTEAATEPNINRAVDKADLPADLKELVLKVVGSIDNKDDDDISVGHKVIVELRSFTLDQRWAKILQNNPVLQLQSSMLQDARTWLSRVAPSALAMMFQQQTELTRPHRRGKYCSGQGMNCCCDYGNHKNFVQWHRCGCCGCEYWDLKEGDICIGD